MRFRKKIIVVFLIYIKKFMSNEAIVFIKLNFKVENSLFSILGKCRRRNTIFYIAVRNIYFMYFVSYQIKAF